ncbi:MAG: riboflavin kinase [Candidatus Komeilibacteria bacterium]|nr:riboflavin kinase [Candidatus Komeilibacteria bacterium]
MRIIGTVIRGKGEGRVLGFPTANLKINLPFILADGVYLAKIKVKDQKYRALAVKGMAQDLEVWLKDFSGDLYGQELAVEIGQKISELGTFTNQQELIAKIKADLKIAEKLWATN